MNLGLTPDFRAGRDEVASLREKAPDGQQTGGSVAARPVIGWAPVGVPASV